MLMLHSAQSKDLVAILSGGNACIFSRRRLGSMFILPLRPLQRAAGLIIIASLMSGCFQTAGAALQATMTPQGGVVIQLPSPVPTTEVPPPTAITPETGVSTPLVTDTPSVPTLVFATQTGLPALPSDTRSEE